MEARNILVTGCNRGIGLEFVHQVLASPTPPTNLFATTPVNSPELDALAKENAAVHVLHLDVTREDQYESVVTSVAQIVGDAGLNVIFNNAGISERSNLEQITSDVMVELFRVNALAPLMVTKAFLPLLKQAASSSSEAGLSHRKAAVFNMSSRMSSIADNTSGGRYSYRTSKCALNMITTSLHRDLSSCGILCMMLHPGWVQTDMGGPDAQVPVSESVAGLIRVMVSATDEQAGRLIDFRGQVLPW